MCTGVILDVVFGLRVRSMTGASGAVVAILLERVCTVIRPCYNAYILYKHYLSGLWDTR
jgi:hypothetical protein